jgi:hypothetical protein
MLYLLLFHCNNGCTNAPQCCVIGYVHCLSCFHFIVTTIISAVGSDPSGMLFSVYWEIFPQYQNGQSVKLTINLNLVPGLIMHVVHSGNFAVRFVMLSYQLI